ncbi:MAG: ROK family protein, partial [Elusimicrobiota bacterium]
MYRIGIDLGGSKIEGIALDEAMEEVCRKRVPTRREEGYEAILKTVQKLYDDLVIGIHAERHSLGIGTPGAISPKTGLLKNSNTVCMNGKPVQKDLERLLGQRIELSNDANCFTLAEARMGAAEWKRVVFGVIMGTGCGGGISVEGKILTGPQRIAGEWGHMVIDPAGPECYCGARGCVETFISGGGLERRYAAEFGEPRTLPQILSAYRGGDGKAVPFMQEFFARFGQAMANLITVLDPDIVVLGGGLSNIDELYTEGVKEVRQRVFSDSLETPIVRNKLGDSAGVIGAALL